MCAFRRSVGPPPLPRARPTTLGRPGATSSTSTSSPASASHSATKRASSPSPAPPGTRSGVTESIRTSSAASSVRLDELNRSAVDFDEPHTDLREDVERLRDHVLAGHRLLEASYPVGDVRSRPDELRFGAVRLVPEPLHPVGGAPGAGR